MIAKASTKNFTEKPQSTSLKGDGVQNLSVRDKEKLLGDMENVGDYLNKITNPNWVDPNKKLRQGGGNNELNKDAFMKLMLEQMKNQDPTNPVKSHEMAAQLAQFTSVEQLSNISRGIDDLKQAQAPVGNFQALNFIGKSVSGDSAKIIRSEGDKEHEIRFTLGSNAKSAEISIYDLNGIVLKKLSMNDLKKGENETSWNGIAENGQVTRSGEYRVKIEAVNDTGKKIHAETKFDGKVSGVNFTADGPVLLVGNKSIKLSEIKKIVDSESTSASVPAQTPVPGVPAASMPQASSPALRVPAKDSPEAITNMMAKKLEDMRNRETKTDKKKESAAKDGVKADSKEIDKG